MAGLPQDADAERTVIDWTDAELGATVSAYLGMLRNELQGKPYVKTTVNQQLRHGVLSGRTKGSIEFRMRNISATLYDLRIPHIPGYLPAKNVGPGVKERIKAALELAGIAEFYDYVPTADHVQLDLKVRSLRTKPLGVIPPGTNKPLTVTTTTTSFVRDPAVKSWVLATSNGQCEGCDAKAPFVDIHGLPYLEVHHVMPLSSHGSDTPSNAVALCPNCHRRCHYSADRDEFKLALYEKLPRLKIEAPAAEDVQNLTYI
ncbi:MAG: HNH endonuclease signature motif containing protein [Pseudomonadota bacterium]